MKWILLGKKKNTWPHLSPRMQRQPSPHLPSIREPELTQRSYGDSSILSCFVPKSFNLSVTSGSALERWAAWPLKYQWTQTHRGMSSSSQQTVHARDGTWLSLYVTTAADRWLPGWGPTLGKVLACCVMTSANNMCGKHHERCQPDLGRLLIVLLPASWG